MCSDRIAEAVEAQWMFDIIVNVQGYEPYYRKESLASVFASI